MDNPAVSELDGLVLGISHGLTGINTKYLMGKVKSFCLSSQDIYFNYIITKKIWENYSEKLKQVKYIVFDMFDYTYFNYSTLDTGMLLNYLYDSGLKCPAEFDAVNNKNINNTVAEINMYMDSFLSQLSESETEKFDDIFENLKLNDENAYGDIFIENKYLKYEDVENYRLSPVNASIQVKMFKDTISKNIDYFVEFLKFVYGKNPDIKIFLCLLPKYIAVEWHESKDFGQWKTFFENIIRQLQNAFPKIYYLNYKEDIEISGNIANYRDITHLNCDGAVFFSKKLAGDIAKILGEL